ncbi:MAG: hypothetical protein OHK0021_18960 [Bryobacter sp.]
MLWKLNDSSLWKVLILMSLLTGCADPRPANLEGPIEGWFIPDRWEVREETREGKRFLIRMSTGLDAAIGNPKLATQVRITVPFRKPSESGMPDSEEYAELDEIEYKIRDEFQMQNEAFFAGIVTGAGMREFFLYSAQPELTRRRAEALRALAKQHEVRVSVSEDKSWATYRSLRNRP